MQILVANGNTTIESVASEGASIFLIHNGNRVKLQYLSYAQSKGGSDGGPSGWIPIAAETDNGVSTVVIRFTYSSGLSDSLYQAIDFGKDSGKVIGIHGKDKTLYPLGETPGDVNQLIFWGADATKFFNKFGSIISPRTFLSDARDSLTGQANFNIALMGGNDFLEVTGGSNNFANGNNGEDYIVLRGGQGRYLGGADNDRLEVYGAEAGSQVNGNRGMDVVTGSVDGVIYRGGSENDTLQVSAGTVWGDKGADTFQAVAGAGVAVVQDYTAGKDFVQGIAGGSFTLTDQGLSYGVGNDQMLLLLNVNDASQVSVI